MKRLNITVEPYTDEELIKLEYCILNTKQYACVVYWVIYSISRINKTV